jgi:hypothetical protein
LERGARPPGARFIRRTFTTVHLRYVPISFSQLLVLFFEPHSVIYFNYYFNLEYYHHVVMMLVNAKQSSLRLLVKQLHPLDRRKCLPQIGDVWTPTRIRGLTTRNVHCNISSLLHNSFVTTTTAISNNNCSTSKPFLRCYSYSSSSATSLLDAGGRKTVNEAYATTAADDEEVDTSSLASRVDRLEKRTKDILSNIQKIQQQNGRQQRDASSPTLSPAIRSHICSVIRSWGSLLWGKSNAHSYRTKFIAESYIQRGVLASHQLLDAIVQEDLRICRSGGRTLLLLDSQVDKNILALCCNVVSSFSFSFFLKS